MKLNQSFTLTRPLPEVWDFFLDIPEVAVCMPGAELLEYSGNDGFTGRMTVKLGPFRAAFEGQAILTTDKSTHSGQLIGKGVDKKGGSRSKMVMDFVMSGENGGTAVKLDADIQLSGPIAQFGRTGIIHETATILIGQFVQNVEDRLKTNIRPDDNSAAAAPPDKVPEAGRSLNAGAVLWMLIRSYFRRIFGRV